MILALASGVRFLFLGHESFWYDEVVTMRLARAGGPVEMLRLLDEIDATRAPLHPLLLSVWLRIFGITEYGGRSLSATFGVATVAILFAIGRRVGTTGTGLWAALLAATSPLLIEYSFEVRMYAMLTLVACGAWWSLLALRDGVTRWRLMLYAGSVVALIYTHPLGMLMAASLAIASFADRNRSGLSVKKWAIVHGFVGLAVMPWLPRYFDHAPEFTSGRLPIRFLLGMPIGFTGGDSRLFLIFLAFIALGLISRKIPGLTNKVAGPNALPVLIWLVVPPSFLYAYSWVGHPVFGPSRYNVFVAPAYLLLIARGLSRMPWIAQAVLAYVLPCFMLATGMMATFPDGPRKADWRSAAAYLRGRDPDAKLIVVSPSPGRNFEVEVARYYLGPERIVIPMPGRAEPDSLKLFDSGEPIAYVSASLREGEPVGEIPDGIAREDFGIQFLNFKSLRLYRVYLLDAP